MGVETAIASALVKIGVSAAIASAAASVIVSSAVSFALTGAFRLLSGKPNQPQLGSVRRNDRTVTVKQTVQPRQIVYGETAVAGTIVYLESTNSNKFLHMVIALAGHEVESITDVFVNDQQIELDADGFCTDDKFGSKIRVKYKLGTDDDTAFSDLVSESDGGYTSSDRGRGVAAAYVRLEFDSDVFPSGIPNFRFLVKGKKVYDPRDALQTLGDKSTYVWSDNAALCISDYMTDLTYGFTSLATRMNTTALKAEANACDEIVANRDGSTETRYTINGAFTSDEEPMDVLSDLLGAMAGKAIYVGGKWKLLAGRYIAPTITLNENHLRGPIIVNALTSRREKFNAIRGTFIDPERDYQPTDFPPLASAAFAEEDNSETIFQDVEHRFTNSARRCQRLNQIALLRSRQQITVSYPASLEAYLLQAGDLVMIDNDAFGWDGKEFEVKSSTLHVDEDGSVGFDLLLKEIASSDFDFDASTEALHDPAPNTNLPNPFEVENPSGVKLETVETTIISGSPATTLKQAQLSWVLPDDRFVVSRGQYEIQWKRSADTNYKPSFFVDGALNLVNIADPQEAGVQIDVRIRSVNVLGIRNPNFVEITGHVIGGTSSGIENVFDYGAISESVDSTSDYGGISETVSTTTDYGSI